MKADKKRLTAKQRHVLLKKCDVKCASLTAAADKEMNEYKAMANEMCPVPKTPTMAHYNCHQKLAKTARTRRVWRLQGKANNCRSGCQYRSGAWGDRLKDQWSDRLQRLKSTPGPKPVYKRPDFWPMRVATLKNGKKVHSIFRVTTLSAGKATTRKKGFYAVYCNKGDAPSKKPDYYGFGENGKSLPSYWIDRDKVNDVKGRAKDGSVVVKTKKEFDEFCGKVMKEY